MKLNTTELNLSFMEESSASQFGAVAYRRVPLRPFFVGETPPDRREAILVVLSGSKTPHITPCDTKHQKSTFPQVNRPFRSWPALR